MKIQKLLKMATLITTVGCAGGGNESNQTNNADHAHQTTDVADLESRLETILDQISSLQNSADAAGLSAQIESLQAALADAQDITDTHGEDLNDLDDRVTDIETQLEGMAELIGTADPYTDEMAIAAVQNTDPWSDPPGANLTDIWSQTDRGYHHLTDSRWTMDNRTDPAGVTPRQELIQMFHETPDCTDGATFSECNSAAALKIYVNGPRITEHDWSDEGLRTAALYPYHTHASGLYLVSFGQGSSVSDMDSSLIPPSGIHLEPRGAHQGLRIDGTANSGENIRIDTTLGSTGIAIYESPLTSETCADIKDDCDQTRPLYIRGGRLHLEDIEIERSANDARGTGPGTLHQESLGIEHFYSWHNDADLALAVPVHCTWSTRVTSESLIKLTSYSTSPDLAQSHSYTIVDVWGPGDAPDACVTTQSIKTDASGVYGYTFSSSLVEQGGFSVAILGPDAEAPLNPGDWRETERPSFMFEVIEPL